MDEVPPLSLLAQEDIKLDGEDSIGRKEMT